MKTVKSLNDTQRHIIMLQKQFNNIRLYHNLGRIKTFRDVMLSLGYSDGELEYAYPHEQLTKELSFVNIKTLESNSISQYETDTAPQKQGPSLPINHEYDGIEFHINSSSISKKEFPLAVQQDKIDDNDNEDDNEDDESFPQGDYLSSPKIASHIKLRVFQQKSALTLLNNIKDKRMRCQLLRGTAGCGKTFIISMVLRKLLDEKFVESYSCIAPYPFVWITRSSIVEQTKHAASEYFGIDLWNELLVVNIEQMRSKFGELFLEEEVEIEKGEETIKWKWREPHHPLVFIIDESHLAKNPNSLQAKIIFSLAEINKPIFIICSSATPFSRVIEAGYFAVNTRMEIK